MCEEQDIKTWFGSHIEQNMNSLYGLALRLTKNAADAEDLVADAVIKAWSAIDSLDDHQRFRPWLFRILHNRFVSDFRKKAVRPQEVSLDASAEDEGGDVEPLLIRQSDEFLDWWANPEREFINTLLGRDIKAAIEELPDAYRVVVVLINIEGLSYDEAAAVLDVSPGTIRSRMNRGRTLLQKALWEHGKDAGLITGQAKTGCTL